MNQLPKGYYAVQPIADNVPELVADSFTYKGVTYAAEVGINLFPTITAALAAATEIPDTVLEGLDYEKFEAPVVLLATGSHTVGRKGTKDQVVFERSVYLLGEKAGIPPNLPSTDPMQPPPANPLRDGTEENESVLRGGYDYGRIRTVGADMSLLVVDGVTTKRSWRFGELRRNPTCDITVHFKNIVHRSPDGHTLYDFIGVQKDNPYHRTAILENIRLDKNFSDCGYGGNLFAFNGMRTVVKNLCVDGTTQLFGFSNIPRTYSCCALNEDTVEMIFKDCFIRDLKGENGICVVCPDAGERAVVLSFENSTIINGSRQNEPTFRVDLPNERCALKLKDCRVIDERGNTAPAIEINGTGKNVVIENTEIKGYAAQSAPAPAVPTVAPDRVENAPDDWTTGTADPHRVVGTKKADFSAMDAYYADCKPYYGDLHAHSNSGGTSDGQTPIGEWVARMDEAGFDFAVLVDHCQMRGYFLPEWSEERFVMGTEPGTMITNLSDTKAALNVMHYNMVFPHKYGLAMVLANFPEFKFHGDELTGRFTYPNFTLERMRELNDYIRSIGGVLSHAHPKILMGSNDPMDYYMGEWSYLEIFTWSYSAKPSYKNYDLWLQILDAGKHVYASGGSDTHGGVTGSCLSTFYTKKRFHTDFMDRIRVGDYAVGGIGLKMMIDGNPMGSQIEYKDGMKLSVRVDDFHKSVWQPDTVYELQVWTDEGLAYSSTFNGKQCQELTLEVQKRRFYRVAIMDLTHRVRVLVSNPIWLDKEPAPEA